VAEVLAYQLPRGGLVLHGLAEGAAGGADAAVGHFHQPMAQQVGARLDAVGTEAA
jgi:hypothetical protein